jgi:hypothetical protein
MRTLQTAQETLGVLTGAVILGYLGLAFGLACIIHERAGRVVFAGHGLGGGQFSPQSDGLSLLDLVQMFAG